MVSLSWILICCFIIELAYQYFITAVASGDDDACTNAAICLERGVGTEKNVLDAMSMYHLGASKFFIIMLTPCSPLILGYILVMI